MAGSGRSPAADLRAFGDLFEALESFDVEAALRGGPRTRRGYAGDLTFFEAVRLLDAELARRSDDALSRAGTRRSDPSQEPFRISQRPTLGFAAPMLAGFARDGWLGKPELEVHFFGLLGPDGPLPLHITELALARMEKGDHVLRQFLDVFHHRLLSLCYRAWTQSRPSVQRESGRGDRYARWVASAIGLDVADPRLTELVSLDVLLYFAGRFAAPTRHADGLRCLLSEISGLPIEIEEFVGSWLELPEGTSGRLGDPGTELGRTTVLGGRVWDCMQRIRIIVGPLDYPDYESLLPGSPRLARFRAVASAYIGDDLDFEVQLVLDRRQVPPLRLDGEPLLGLTSWVTTRAPDRDPRTELSPVQVNST